MTEVKRIRVCPKCGAAYHGIPAVSRVDNETLICPDCGTREALTAIGVDEEQQEHILTVIHRSGYEEAEF